MSRDTRRDVEEIVKWMGTKSILILQGQSFQEGLVVDGLRNVLWALKEAEATQAELGRRIIGLRAVLVEARVASVKP